MLAEVRRRTGVDLQVLSGDDEARLTFLAVRRWFGWSAGRLLALDIGGGSFEVAAGEDETPDVAASLPLGASRLTRDWLRNDPPKRSEMAALRKYAKAQLAPLVKDLYELGEPNRVVATSKSFRSLARIAGAAPVQQGPVCAPLARPQRISRASPPAGEAARLRSAPHCPASRRAAPRNCSRPPWSPPKRWTCSVSTQVEICPWALREGVILSRLDHLPAE